MCDRFETKKSSFSKIREKTVVYRNQNGSFSTTIRLESKKHMEIIYKKRIPVWSFIVAICPRIINICIFVDELMHVSICLHQSSTSCMKQAAGD